MTSQEKWLNHIMSGGLVALLWLLPMMPASAYYQVLIEDNYTNSDLSFVQYQECHTGGQSYQAVGTPNCSSGVPTSGTDTSLNFSQTSTQSSSFVSADLGTGELKLNFFGLSSGDVSFSDVLRLEGLGANDTATVIFELDVEGTYARSDHGVGGANFSFYAVSGLEEINTSAYDLVRGTVVYSTESGSNVVNSTAAPEVFSTANIHGDWQQLSTNRFLATIDVLGSDPTLLFIMYLGAGSPADFSHTGRISLSPLPTGVTFTSDSGVFLSQRTPTTPVPEPASLGLLGIGLAGLGFTQRRRRTA